MRPEPRGPGNAQKKRGGKGHCSSRSEPVEGAKTDKTEKEQKNDHFPDSQHTQQHSQRVLLGINIKYHWDAE